MIEVYICKLPAKREKATLNSLLSYVSAERQNRVRKFMKVDDVYRSLIGNLMVRIILKERYGSSVEELEVGINAYGKPFLSGYPSFQYNISHSGEYVVCAVHDEEVGVDIEKVGPFDLQLAMGFFTEEEYRDLLNAKEDGIHAFYDIWTLKESYIKAIGKGLSFPLNSFNVKKHNNDSIQLTDVLIGKPITDYICKQYMIDSDYSLSVCAHQANINQFNQHLNLVSFKEICCALCVSS
ncbi:4'-phosphopantetheinyl transferase superfamily protein [Viridibacillus sp. YIM B01967]|uniref:4'-phosphopantetheinyl transferase superfamily protein n=1 Tax=Viridibacillus soli TaxID=2798301 RepID=A0ABS1HBK1_9BACL|nr:4'-phosphopantetheinyl transferase superfamily protein [Viridibacillus soli]MBK3496766.1 4'-phosphopantetheinyl transferase superfamily protein [Viridibacillus soli]